MKITLITLSPSGNTHMIGKNIKNQLEALERINLIQHIELTENHSFFSNSDKVSWLWSHVNPHDVLIVGSPVYAHHFQYHMMDLLKSLPEPCETWSKTVIPFVTYGGITSGLALEEAGQLLSEKGRIIPFGAKFSMPHRMTRGFMANEFNSDYDHVASASAIIDIVERISNLDLDNPVCNKAFLSYQNQEVKQKTLMMAGEKIWHKERYPTPIINEDNCINCELCASDCPVGRLHLNNNRQLIINENIQCIHCFNCVVTCKFGGIKIVGELERARKVMDGFIRAPKESPMTCVYPI